MRDQLAVYGSVAMARVKCPGCGDKTLVVKGAVTACCGLSVTPTPMEIKRESECAQARRAPGPKEKAEILAAQNGRCCICEKEIGASVLRVSRSGVVRPVTLRVNFDHLVPYSYQNANAISNFAAACHVCNSIKGSKLFATFEELKSAIAIERDSKGWQF